MTASRFRFHLGLALCCAMLGSALAWQTSPASQIRRIYVEPFATQQGSESFREGVVKELQKQNSVSLVANESESDAILGGNGEVWIKGYRSHNPQLGDVPHNGSPIYGGFLAIELTDKQGETLWSYLATPKGTSENVTKDLSRQVVERLTEFLKLGEVPSQNAPPPQPTTVLKGAGATFPYPVYMKWFRNYQHQAPSVQITYDPVGSEAGMRRLLAKSVDFGASDSPQAIHDIAPEDDNKYLFFPSVIGAVVPVVNLPGLSSDVAFTPEALAGIYLGKIKKWNDPVLTRANRGVRLPDLDIVVVHRVDGSGSSYAWTDYLSRANLEWKAKVGTSLNPKWPVGREAEGNDGVSKLVKEQSGSIGYVELIYALQNHLSYGRVRNRDGKFVAASIESIGAAVGHSEKTTSGFKVSIVDAAGANSYPISSLTWIVIPAVTSDSSKRSALIGFLKWMLGPGQRQAAALGYLPLPTEISTKEIAAITRMK